MTGEEILCRAAELVETSWAQGPDGGLNHDHGPYCAGIALQIAAAGQLLCDGDSAWTAFCREIGAGHLCDIPTWNDAPRRTQTEVATALRSAKRWL